MRRVPVRRVPLGVGTSGPMIAAQIVSISIEYKQRWCQRVRESVGRSSVIVLKLCGSKSWGGGEVNRGELTWRIMPQ